MLLDTYRVFADHYQFYLYDSEFDHYSDERLAFVDSTALEFGYRGCERAIYVSTVAGLNDHRVRVYLDQTPEGSYERRFEWDISIPSGTMVISSPAYTPDEEEQISLPAGDYRMVICSSAIGVDELTDGPSGDDPMEDEEFFTHDDFEHYDIYLTKRSTKPVEPTGTSSLP